MKSVLGFVLALVLIVLFSVTIVKIHDSMLISKYVVEFTLEDSDYHD